MNRCEEGEKMSKIFIKIQRYRNKETACSASENGALFCIVEMENQEGQDASRIS
jgi:hypothetical protein